MEIYNEIISFSRAFINDPKERTAERRAIIARAYKSLTGENLRVNCSTCYIEAIFKIIKAMETKKEPCNYRLKKGARLTAFSDASKYCDNNNLTDALAEWHLAHNPGCAIKFEIMPKEPTIVINFDDLGYNELKRMCKEKGIKATGDRTELIDKLQNN